jgi:hypothetical protein
MGEIAKLVDGLMQLSLGLGEQALQRWSRRLSRIQAETDGEGQQPLLRAVVEVALHPPAFCLGGGEGALLGCPHPRSAAPRSATSAVRGGSQSRGR